MQLDASLGRILSNSRVPLWVPDGAVADMRQPSATSAAVAVDAPELPPRQASAKHAANRTTHLALSTCGWLYIAPNSTTAGPGAKAPTDTVARVALSLIGGVPADIAVLVSRHKQRLGDMVAGTFVLRERDVARMGVPAP